MIEIANVTHRFRPQKAGGEAMLVLSNVSLAISDQQFVSFLGPSGCGKTTLLRIIAGLVAPTQGIVRIDGNEVRGPKRERAVVFQEANLFPWRNVRRNVEAPLEFHRIQKSERRRIAGASLDMVGMSSFETFFPHQLSGGMKQRVGIARALTVRPTYLLMDEPFGALDPLTREIMQLDMLKLFESEPRTIIFVTHSIDEAIFLSDRIVVFSRRPGRVLEVIDVDMPKRRWERDQEIKASSQFTSYRKKIWGILKEEVKEPVTDAG